MKFVIQRVNHASVTVDGVITGQISKGLLVFIGVGQNDTKETADQFLKKMLGLRIFEDENGKRQTIYWGALDTIIIQEK